MEASELAPENALHTQSPTDAVEFLSEEPKPHWWEIGWRSTQLSLRVVRL